MRYPNRTIGCRRLAVSAGWIFWVAANLPLAVGQDRLPGGADGSGDVAAMIRQLDSTATSLHDRAKLCQRLAILGDATAVPSLAELLSDPKLSGYARTALERIPGPEAEAALVTALTEVPDPVLRVGIIHSAGQRAIEAAVPSLERLAEGGTPAERTAATRALGRIRDSDPSPTDTARGIETAVRQITAGLVSHAPDKFRQALDMAWAAGSSGTRTVAETLPRLPPERQAMALAFLSDVADSSDAVDPVVVDSVPSLLDSPHPEVASRAFQTLVSAGRYDASAGIPPWVITRPELAGETLPMLASLRNPDIDEDVLLRLTRLAQGLADDTSLGDVLAAAGTPETLLVGLASYSGERHLAGASQALLEMSGRAGRRLRAVLLRTAAATVTPTNLGPFLSSVDQARPSLEEPDASAIVDRALVRMPPDRAAAVIGARMAAENEIAPHSFRQLAFVGGEQALKIVSDAARQDDEAWLDAATQALGQWPTADAADPMEELIVDLPPSRYRIRLIRGYLRAIRQFDMPVDERIRRGQRLFELCDRDAERELVRDTLRQYGAAPLDR